MVPTESLSRKIRWIFILQAVVASLLVVFGTLYGGSVLRDVLLKQRIVNEAEHVWELLETQPGQAAQQSSTFDTYFVRTGGMPDNVPPELRALTPGLHRMRHAEWRLAYVSQRAEGTVYMRIAPGLTDRVVRWMAMLAVLLAVTGISLISWLGYRRCKRIVAPVSRLTNSVLSWDPHVVGPARFDDMPVDRGDSTYEVTHLSEALVNMSRRMDDYVERERNFTRDASHELRTPVTVVRVAGDLLSTEPVSARGERSLKRIRQATHDMEVLIDAFLVLARHPDVPVDSEDVDVLDVAHEAVAAAAEGVEGKDVTLRVIETAAPDVHAPPRVLGVILSQLIRNACNFTAKGSVEVEVFDDRVEVRDTGVGMDAAAISRAFDPFWRADISDHTAKGMGLTIAQRLAERVGWHISLQSEPGAGTRAILRFA